MKIKVCGLRHFKNISEITQLDIDYVGLIFYNRSARFINGSLSFDEARQIDPKVKKVGVFVNESMDSIVNTVAQYKLDMVQLHGDESAEFCKKLKPFVKIIKAFGINRDFDFQTLKDYETAVDHFLFDTAAENYGGSGKAFDWDLLNKYDLNVPFFLSGGISEANIQTIKQLNIKQLGAIDINSKFEVSPGLKDVNKIKIFVNQFK